MTTLDFLTIFFYIVGTIISIVMIVKYFLLCKDVEAIRNFQNPLVDFNERFALLLSVGEKEEAKRLLLSRIQKHSVFGEAFGSAGQSYTKSSREEITRAYGRYLEALGMDFDFDAVDDFIQASRRNTKSE